MKLQQLLSVTRKAVDEFHMIQEGDKIAVGISGGKDSLTLLYALRGLQRFYPNHPQLYLKNRLLLAQSLKYRYSTVVVLLLSSRLQRFFHHLRNVDSYCTSLDHNSDP